MLVLTRLRAWFWTWATETRERRWRAWEAQVAQLGDQEALCCPRKMLAALFGEGAPEVTIREERQGEEKGAEPGRVCFCAEHGIYDF